MLLWSKKILPAGVCKKKHCLVHKVKSKMYNTNGNDLKHNVC